MVVCSAEREGIPPDGLPTLRSCQGFTCNDETRKMRKKVVIVTELSQFSACPLAGPVGKSRMGSSSGGKLEALPKLSKGKVMERFAARLRHWRESQGKTISNVSGEIGVAVSTWGHWETGYSFPSVDNLLLVADYTRIPVHHLLCPNAHKCPFPRTDDDGR